MRYDALVLDDRTFLLGLDQLYRKAMQERERHELLGCARDVVFALGLAPEPVPLEGYYATDPNLAEYFRLMRTLQRVRASRIAEVRSLLAYQRLCQVLSSRIFGRAVHGDTLLPVGFDPLSQALRATPHWSIPTLTVAARAAALSNDDCSLVGLAAWLQDPVVLVALRESVVLYAVMLAWGTVEEPEIAWAVDPELAERAARFIAAFRALFGTGLPAPEPKNAYDYWKASRVDQIVGRCVRIASDDRVEPVRHYHWAIDHGPVNEFVAREFWETEVWTTDRYREAMALHERPLGHSLPNR